MLVLDRNVTLDINFHIKTSTCHFSIYSPCLSHPDFFYCCFCLASTAVVLAACQPLREFLQGNEALKINKN